MGTDIKEYIIGTIREFVAEENMQCSMKDLWREPLVGFADVNDPYIRQLRSIVHKEHQMPEEVMSDASIVIVYFVPFSMWLADTNRGNEMSSPEWAQAYEETNAMFARLNAHIISELHKIGYKGKTAPEAQVFHRDEVMSHWSFRHFAYAAGLGTFGLNNMLITEKGCAGRVNTVVTNLDIEGGKPRTEELCLFRKNGTCGLCVRKCPAGALTETGFDRHKCFEQCLKNAAVYTGFGSSYASEAGGEAENSGSEVCGKCVAGMPCTYKMP